MTDQMKARFKDNKIPEIWMKYTIDCWLSAFYTLIWKFRNNIQFEHAGTATTQLTIIHTPASPTHSSHRISSHVAIPSNSKPVSTPLKSNTLKRKHNPNTATFYIEIPSKRHRIEQHITTHSITSGRRFSHIKIPRHSNKRPHNATNNDTTEQHEGDQQLQSWAAMIEHPPPKKLKSPIFQILIPRNPTKNTQRTVRRAG